METTLTCPDNFTYFLSSIGWAGLFTLIILPAFLLGVLVVLFHYRHLLAAPLSHDPSGRLVFTVRLDAQGNFRIQSPLNNLVLSPARRPIPED